MCYHLFYFILILIPTKHILGLFLNKNSAMVSKLHSVRRSLFEEFGEEENDNNALNRKSSKQPTRSSIIPIKLSNAFVFCALITVGTIAILSE